MKELIKNGQKGISIVGILLLGFVLILVLSYFKVNIRTVVESPEAQDNIGYVKGGTVSLWDRYLKEPATYFWDNIVVNIFWNSFISNMEKIRDGQSTDFETAAPTVNVLR